MLTKKKSMTVLAGVLAAVILGLFVRYIVLPQWNENVALVEVSLNSQKQVLEKLSERTTIKISTTGSDGVLGLVGLVLVASDSDALTPAQFNRSSVLPQFRPDKSKLVVEPLSKLLYEGRVSNSLGAGAAYAEAAANLDGSQVAELVIKDDVFFGFNDIREIPYAALYKFMREDAKPDKRYYFVESATLTSTVYRTFVETEGKAGGGTVFKANGRVFASSKGYANDSVVSVEVWDLAALESGEAGTSSSKIPKLLAKQLKGEISDEESNGLRSAMSSETKITGELGAVDLSDIEDSSHEISSDELPLSGLELKYDHRIPGDVPHLRQPSANTCWATVAAMLAGWRTEPVADVTMYLQGIGGHYADLYRSDKPLRRVDKKSFLSDADFAFDYGMSYHPQGLLKLLKDHGPIWFTITQDDEFSKHASIVIAIYGTDEITETFIVFIDPFDGREHALTYGQFMQKYEEIASQQNEIGESLEGFQVVYNAK